jgi:hypothetical protein
MTVDEIRAKYWRAMQRINDSSNLEPEWAKVRQIELLQAEMLCEMAVQQARTNEILERTIGVVGFEKLALQLGLLLEELGTKQ